MVRGQINASDRLELHRTAQVRGMIQAARIRIDEGAAFEGECRMAGKDAAKSDDKRSTPVTRTATATTTGAPGAAPTPPKTALPS
jgi:cytoskeletal protein CcmA (bactofilin family)